MFLKELMDHPRGKIVCCNVVDGLADKIYDCDFVKEVFDWWQDLCRHKNITDIDKKINGLRDLAFDLGGVPADFRPGVARPEFSFTVQRSPDSLQSNGRLSYVMPAIHLGKNLSEDDHKRFDREGVSIPAGLENWSPKVVKRLQNLPSSERVFTMNAAGITHPVCLWYTRALDLDMELNGTGDKPSRARDVLGLVHYGDELPLAVVYIADDQPALADTYRPTFIEAGDGRRFKARVVSPAKKKLSSWGHTTDLEELTHNRLTDGCPERVARPLSPGSTQFSFEILGTTSGERGEPQDHADNEYANILVDRKPPTRGRTDADVEAEIRRCLQ